MEDLLAERGLDISYESIRYWVLEVLVQSRRNKKAALKLIRKLLKKQGFLPSAFVTDRLLSYGAALRELGLSRHHDFGGRKNNRA